MGKSSVSGVITAIQSVERELGAVLSAKEKEYRKIKGRFDEYYGEVKTGVSAFAKGADSARLSALSRAASKAGKPFDFESLGQEARSRNAEIVQELKYFEDFFGGIASPPDSGKPAVAPDGLTAAEIEKRLRDKIDNATHAPQLIRLGAILRSRGKEQTVADAQAFLDSCRNRSLADFFRPSVWVGRSINREKDKGTFDAVAEIEGICARQINLSALQRVESLKDKYTLPDELDDAVRDRVLETFNSVSSFGTLASVMGRDVYTPLGDAFTKAAQAQREMDDMKPVLGSINGQINAVKKDVSLLKDIKNLDFSQSVPFDGSQYADSLQGGQSAFTRSFAKILDDLQEIERQKRAREAEERRRREDEERSRSSDDDFGGSISIGGGDSGFSGGGGSFGGGGASGSWITCDPEAEPGVRRKSFDLSL